MSVNNVGDITEKHNTVSLLNERNEGIVGHFFDFCKGPDDKFPLRYGHLTGGNAHVRFPECRHDIEYGDTVLIETIGIDIDKDLPRKASGNIRIKHLGEQVELVRHVFSQTFEPDRIHVADKGCDENGDI